MSPKYWSVALSKDTATDFVQILQWTKDKFGAGQAETYRTTLRQALQALHGGPNILEVKKRDDIAPHVLTLHVARNGRKGRHFIVFRIRDECCIEVLRLLHDSMDLSGHLQTRL